MRYCIDFRSTEKKRKTDEHEYGDKSYKKSEGGESEGEESEGEEKELERIFSDRKKKSIFQQRMGDYLNKNSPSPPKKRLSSLARSPSVRSTSKNTRGICYQYAAMHIFKNIIDNLGYDSDEYMSELNLDLVDEKYIEALKPVYLKLLHDPDDERYFGINKFPFVEDDNFVSVSSRVSGITDEFITLSYYHPNEESTKKEIMIERSEIDCILEQIPRGGSAYDYLDAMLDVLSEADLIDQNQILSLERDPQNVSRKIGEFIRVKRLDSEIGHVVSVVEELGNFELVDNHKKKIFGSYENLIEYLTSKYKLEEIQNVFLIEREIEGE